ncbi:DUF4133 domain-containing protein [Pedobacter sp. P26]|uniref:DUF4133 domain-containing protein n=1 Tax=Pedobacter sp. P26 TaxID=3423956 RepID=UPI003D66F0EF
MGRLMPVPGTGFGIYQGVFWGLIQGYPIYKGLDLPLVYRGFKGKFIYYGIGSLAAALALGGISGALFGMYAGGFLTIAAIAGGLFYTFHKQKSGLHSKTRNQGIFIHPVKLKISYAERKENGI